MSKPFKALASALPLAAALVLAAAPRTAHAQLIVAPGETIDGLTINAVGRVGINDANQLVFQALCSDASGSYNAVFVRDVTTGAAQLVVKTGDTIDGLLLTGIFQPTINDAGQVVFVGFFASGEGLFEIDLGSAPLSCS